MRVVAGSARGRRLLTVPGDGTRPILDRVKTALFDMLRPQLAGMRVLDLFAGSGSVGIEALSQGASACTFVERGHNAIGTIKKNLAMTGLADKAEVIRTDSFAFLRTTKASFDLIYVAPPQYKNLWVEAMHLIAARPALLKHAVSGTDDEDSTAMVIAQIDPKEYSELKLQALCEQSQRRYGNTMLVFFGQSGGIASECVDPVSSGEGSLPLP